jgi:hypothetical protein
MSNTHRDPEECEHNGKTLPGFSHEEIAARAAALTLATTVKDEDADECTDVSMPLQVGHVTRMPRRDDLARDMLATTQVCTLCEAEASILVEGLCWSCSPMRARGSW